VPVSVGSNSERIVEEGASPDALALGLLANEIEGRCAFLSDVELDLHGSEGLALKHEIGQPIF